VDTESQRGRDCSNDRLTNEEPGPILGQGVGVAKNFVWRGVIMEALGDAEGVDWKAYGEGVSPFPAPSPAD